MLLTRLTKIGDLVKHYPRGEKQLRKTFSQFMTSDTIEWFESRGVPLVTQEDLCIFPKAQDSQVIIDINDRSRSFRYIVKFNQYNPLID